MGNVASAVSKSAVAVGSVSVTAVQAVGSGVGYTIDTTVDAVANTFSSAEVCFAVYLCVCVFVPLTHDT
jgi:hypothetical protein